MDTSIRKGATLQRIEGRDTGGKLHDVFYASKGKHDNKRYFNLYGMQNQRSKGAAYVMRLKNNEKIKVASKKNAMKVFEDLYRNDKSFRSAFGDGNVDPNSLDKKTYKKMYDIFNQYIPGMRNERFSEGKPYEKFFGKLKEAGYGAIQDINDKKYSGFNAKNPLIIFDNSNVMTEYVSKINEDLSRKGIKELSKARAESVIQQTMEKYGPYGVLGLTGAAAVTSLEDISKTHWYDKQDKTLRRK